DDGTVMEAFSAAIAAQNLPAATYNQAMTDVRSSMGQSKIEVFRRILGDEETAQKANDVFEDHYASAVRRGAVAAVPGAEETITALRQAGVRVCLATGFSPATRDAIIDKLVWGGLIDLALSPADAGFWGFEGRGRDRGRRADRRQLPRGLGAGRRAAHPRHDRGRPPLRHRVTARGDEHRLGGQGYRDRGAWAQRGGLGARLVDLDGDVAVQPDADPGHRAEEGPGGHDPVAVLRDLHRQSFWPHEH